MVEKFPSCFFHQNQLVTFKKKKTRNNYERKILQFTIIEFDLKKN